MIKKTRYFLEAIAVRIAFKMFSLFPVETAANIGSFLARFIGPLLPVHQLAKRNLRTAIPSLSKREIKGILWGMWDNLGRNVGEYTHITNFSDEQIDEYVSIDKKTRDIVERLKSENKGGILFSGHLGNWEAGHRFLNRHNIDIGIVYRPLNNQMVENIIALMRKTKLIPKGTAGAKQILQELKQGHYVIILVDQRMGEGIEIPFFDKKAQTASAVANLALKYNTPLIPIRVIRIDKTAKFKIELREPINITKTGNLQKDTEVLMLQINAMLEKWIREYPEQWFWVHDRWKIK